MPIMAVCAVCCDNVIVMVTVIIDFADNGGNGNDDVT